MRRCARNGDVFIVNIDGDANHVYLLSKQANTFWLIDADRGISKPVTRPIDFIIETQGWSEEPVILNYMNSEIVTEEIDATKLTFHACNMSMHLVSEHDAFAIKGYGEKHTEEPGGSKLSPK